MQNVTRRRRSRAYLMTGSNADLSWQKRLVNHNASGDRFGYVSDRDLNRSRMTFGVELPDFDADMNPVFGGREAHSERRRRLDDERTATEESYAEPVSRDGLRGTIALGAMLLLVIALFGIWFSNRAPYRATMRRIAGINGRLSKIEEEYAYQERNYLRDAESFDVGYRAVDQGMISAKGYNKVEITVPQNAVLTPYEATVRSQEERVAASIQH